MEMWRQQSGNRSAERGNGKRRVEEEDGGEIQKQRAARERLRKYTGRIRWELTARQDAQAVKRKPRRNQERRNRDPGETDGRMKKRVQASGTVGFWHKKIRKRQLRQQGLAQIRCSAEATIQWNMPVTG